MFAEIRYETCPLHGSRVGAAALLQDDQLEHLRPYAFVYAPTPAYLLPRIWQSIVRGNIPEQEPGTVTFSWENFSTTLTSTSSPFCRPRSLPCSLGGLDHAWAAWVLSSGSAGSWFVFAKATGTLTRVRFAAARRGLGAGASDHLFTYVWGRAHIRRAARLFIAIDTFFSVSAAWVVVLALRRFRPFVAVLFAAAVLAIAGARGLPAPHVNRLTQTRESSTTWKFFERLGEKRILIVTDRPNLFTIMDYGAMSFESAKSDPYLFTAFARHLFYDIYVIQQIELSTGEPLPGYDIWPDSQARQRARVPERRRRVGAHLAPRPLMKCVARAENEGTHGAG